MNPSSVREITRVLLALVTGALLVGTLLSAPAAVASVGVGGQRTELESLLRAPGGGVLVVGTTGTCAAGSERPACPPDQILLSRLAADGRPDASFGEAGVVTTAVPGGTVRVGGAVMTREGKVLVTGTLLPSRGGFGGSRLLLLGYLPDGAPDPGFGSDGVVAVDPPGDTSAEGTAVDVAPDGDVLVAGSAAPPGRNPSFLLARFGPDGTLDPSFGEGGFAAPAFAGGLGSRADALALTGAGDVVVGGGARIGPSEESLSLARYLPDGRLDPDFGTAGTLSASSFRGEFAAARISSLVTEPTGAVVALGSGQAGEHAAPRVELLRVGADGAPVSRRTLRLGGPVRPALAAATLLPDGESLLAGTAEGSPVGRLLLLGRFAAGGREEHGFRPGPIGSPGEGRYIGGAALLAAGRGAIVGTTVRAARCPGAVPRRGMPCHAIVLRRFRGDGSRARNFGEGGAVVIPATRLCRRSGALAHACGRPPVGGQDRRPSAARELGSRASLWTMGEGRCQMGKWGERQHSLSALTEVVDVTRRRHPTGDTTVGWGVRPDPRRPEGAEVGRRTGAWGASDLRPDP